MELAEAERVLRYFVGALGGGALTVGTTGAGDGLPGTDGWTVCLPPRIAEFPREEDNFRLYKAMAAFQVARRRYGREGETAPGRAAGRERLRAALGVWLEDERIEAELLRELPGLREDLRFARRWALGCRPVAGLCSPRTRGAEAFLRDLLAGDPGTAVPPGSPRRVTEELAAEAARGLARLPGWFRSLAPVAYRGRPVAAGRWLDGGAAEGGGAAEDGPSRRAGAGRVTEVRPRSPLRRIDPGEAEPRGGLALNRFEKLETWAEFVPVRRPVDDGEAGPAGALSDLDELALARGDGLVIPRYRFSLEIPPAEAGDGAKTGAAGPARDEEVYLYHEWDVRRGSWRPRWAAVREAEAPRGKGEEVAAIVQARTAEIRRTRRRLEALAPKVAMLAGQADGEEVDLDAAVRLAVDVRAGRCPDEAVYRFRRRRERDLASLVLVDQSASTDAWVGGRRVVDLEREALVLFCEAVRALGDRYAVYGFCSNTRHDCRLWRVKGFGEAYGPAVRARIDGLQPRDYTRMGAAIRHATMILRRVEARRRLLLILSDGRPDDLDVYEGRYGLADTRQAVLEARTNGVVPACLSVDARARLYLPEMFGRGNCVVLERPEELPARIAALYRRLTR